MTGAGAISASNSVFDTIVRAVPTTKGVVIRVWGQRGASRPNLHFAANTISKCLFGDDGAFASTFEVNVSEDLVGKVVEHRVSTRPGTSWPA